MITPFGRRPPPKLAMPSRVGATPSTTSPKPKRVYLSVAPHKIVTRRNPRHGSVEQYHVGSLAESMKDREVSPGGVGQLHPIGVRPLPANDKRRQSGAEYELVWGERRWRAALEAGLETVEVAVEEMSDDLAADRAWHENRERVKLTVWSLITECADRSKRGQTPEQIANLARLTIETVKDYLSIANDLAPDLMEKLQYNASPETVDRLIRCAKVSGGIGREPRYMAQRIWWDAEVKGLHRQPTPQKPPRMRGPEPLRVRASTVVRYANKIEQRCEIADADTGEMLKLTPRVARAVAAAMKRWAKKRRDRKPRSDRADAGIK